MLPALSHKGGLNNSYQVTYYCFNRTSKLRRIFHPFNSANKVNDKLQNNFICQVTRNGTFKFNRLPCSNNCIPNCSKSKFTENSSLMPTCIQKLRFHKEQPANWIFKKLRWTHHGAITDHQLGTCKQVGFLFYFPSRN